MKKILLFLLISVGSVWGFAIQAKKLEVKDLMVQKKRRDRKHRFQNSVPFCVSAIQER